MTTTTSPSEHSDPVITGIGVLAPTGIGVEQHWHSVLSGKSGISRTTLFDAAPYPVRLAGQVPGFTVGQHVPRKLIAQTDRWSHFALAATDQALADSGIDPEAESEYKMAVTTASSSGGTEFGQHEMERLYTKGPQWVSAYQSIAWFYAATTGQISIRHGMRGPCGVVCAEQAGGLDAIGQATRYLDGDVEVVVTGGTDASLCPYGLVAQLSSGQLSTASEPGPAYLPFDVDASGYVPGEGGAILLAERAEHAAERDAQPYGRIRGYAAGFDPQPGSARPPALAATIRRALDRAQVSTDEVDVVFADGMGVAEHDRTEAAAITALFGPRGVPVTVPKTLTGRLYGGGASLDVATALLSLRDGVVPHTVGPSRLAPGCELDLVLGTPREQPIRTALVVARGFGGFTAALVLGAP